LLSINSGIFTYSIPVEPILIETNTINLQLNSAGNKC